MAYKSVPKVSVLGSLNDIKSSELKHYPNFEYFAIMAVIPTFWPGFQDYLYIFCLLVLYAVPLRLRCIRNVEYRRV